MARTYRVTFHCHHSNGTLVEPSLHYQTDVPTGGDEPDPDDVAAGVWTELGTQFLGALTGDVTVDTVVATEQVVPPDIGAQGAHNVNAVGVNSESDTKLPLALVPILNLRTHTVSRSARGYMTMASPRTSTSLASGGAWASGWIDLWTSLCNRFDNSFDLGTLIITHVNPVVYSRKRHRAGTTPYTFRVTAASPNARPHWLRTRTTSP